MKLDYVISPFYPVADKIDVSHRAGWARYWANATGAKLLTTKTMIDGLLGMKKGDTVGVYHGMEFRGQMNLQSGLTESIIYRSAAMVKAARKGVKFVSLDQGMPDYGQMLAERGLDERIAASISDICKKTTRALVPTRTPSKIVVGDSHSLSQYDGPGTIIYRKDGQTLYGIVGPDGLGMEKHLSDWAWETDVDLEAIEIIRFYFGNIDIRHHLLRTENPKKSVTDLVKRYVQQVSEIDVASMNNEIVLPLPIEHECRRIPKSGWYKGEPFFGSWKERTEIQRHTVKRIKIECKKYGVGFIPHPDHFTNKQGELAFEVMERPRSVHIAPFEYSIVNSGDGW